MHRNLRFLPTLGSSLLLVCTWLVGAVLSAPAQAQTICNSSLVIGFPNGDNLNRTIGQTVRMSLTVTNGPSQDAGANDDQTFSLVHFFPSCTSVAGGVCTADPGAAAGAPPPIAYNGNLSQGTCPSLPVVNQANPFDITFSFVPPFTFPNTQGCVFSFDVLVTEAGSAVSTPLNVQQLAVTDGTCDSTLTSQGLGTSAITLTCPVCDDGNVCNGTEVCNTTTATCTPGTPLNCNDGNACTADSCTPATGCVNTPNPPSACNDNNACTTDSCAPATGCVNTPVPPDFCDDNNQCTEDVCDPQDGCIHRPADPMPPECEGSCRMTGGHNYDVVDAEFNENGKVYTTGGQIGAPNESGCCALPPKGKCVAGTCTGGLNGGNSCSTNADCPNDPGRNSHCPWGDWEHNHHSGPDDSNSVTGGSFAFHSGTAAAPNEAFIQSVLCADPGWCVQARPAPFKQIYWEGTGVFHNIKGPKGSEIPLPIFSACGEIQPTPYSNKPGGTLHYYKAHVSDFGEPAGIYQKPIEGCQKDESCSEREPNQSVEIGACTLGDVCLIDQVADPVKTALHPLCSAQTCSECPDEYEIEIHCTADPSSPIAYRVSHEIREGNFQLHPPVGDSCNPSCGDGACEAGVTGTAETCQTCPEDCCP